MRTQTWRTRSRRDPRPRQTWPYSPAGTGEGAVEVYVGVDGSGLPVEVVADFLVLVEPEELVLRVDDPDELAPGKLKISALNALGINLREARPPDGVVVKALSVLLQLGLRSL